MLAHLESTLTVLPDVIVLSCLSGRSAFKCVATLWTRSAIRLSLGRPPSAPSLTASAPLTSTPPRLPRRPPNERLRAHIEENFDADVKPLEIRGLGVMCTPVYVPGRWPAKKTSLGILISHFTFPC